MQRTLFEIKKKEPEQAPIFDALFPVELDDIDLFNERIYKQLPKPILYNHCFHYLYSYFAGVKTLYKVPTGSGIVAVAQKYKTKPRFYIHAPTCAYEHLLALYKILQKQSATPVRVIDLNQEQVDKIISNEPEKWKIIKDGKDVIFDLHKCIEMKGNGYKGIRNGINYFKKTFNYEVVDMDTAKVADDAVQVIRDWQQKQGKKYFRVTVGRDVEIFKRFWSLVDNKTTFGLVIYDKETGKPIAATMGCVSPLDQEMGIELTTKVDIDYKGLTDFISLELFKRMYEAGVRYTNEAGIYSPGIKKNKEKWHPVDYYPMFQLERIEENEEITDGKN